VLLDEIEKAHPDVFNMLLQIMEEGRLTDSFGRHVDFRNVVLIMTSNLGSQQMKSGNRLGFDRVANTDIETNDEDRKKRMTADVMLEVERHFRPEFLNRVDELVIFNALSHDDLKRIVHIQLMGVRERLADRAITLELEDSSIEFLINKGFNADYGARPLRRAIERYIEDPLAEQILRADFEGGSILGVTAAEDNESLEFEPRGKPTPPEPEKVETNS
jgi:ATP-dependent Clp protease ATP-binding subunit ClpC